MPNNEKCWRAWTAVRSSEIRWLTCLMRRTTLDIHFWEPVLRYRASVTDIRTPSSSLSDTILSFLKCSFLCFPRPLSHNSRIHGCQYCFKVILIHVTATINNQSHALTFSGPRIEFWVSLDWTLFYLLWTFVLFRYYYNIIHYYNN